MIPTIEVELECPSCESIQEHLINIVIDGLNDNKLKSQLLKRELNLLECRKCRNQGHYEHPLLYHDRSKRLIIWYFDGDKTPYDTEISFDFFTDNLLENPYNLRLTFTYEELCEKIRIFDSNIDEIEVEYFKMMFLLERAETSKNALDKIFFNGIISNNEKETELKFLVVSEDRYKELSFPLENYNKIVEGCRQNDAIVKNIPMNEWLVIDSFYISGFNPFDKTKSGYAVSGEEVEYKGIFNSGDINGKGVYIYSKGEIYIGECEKGKPHGFGILSALSNEKYIGTIFNNKYSGHGKYLHYDGSIYEGEFENDLYHGKGTLTKKDGKQYSGFWHKGLLMHEDIGLNPYFHEETGISFPLKMNEMDRVNVANYKLTKPHLGVAINYDNRSNINGTIYLYPSIAGEKVQHDELLNQHNKVIDEVYKGYEEGFYDAVVKVREGTECFQIVNEEFEMMFSEFMLSRRGTKAHSYLYLGVLDTFFLKIRFTYDEEDKDIGDRLREQFLEDTLELKFHNNKDQIL